MIQLNENWSITADKLNVMLNYRNKRKVIDKNGKEKTVVSEKTTYHNSIKQAIESYSNEQFNEIAQTTTKFTAEDLTIIMSEYTIKILRELKEAFKNQK